MFRLAPSSEETSSLFPVKKAQAETSDYILCGLVSIVMYQYNLSSCVSDG